MRNKSLLFLSVFILFYVYTHAQSQVYNLKGTVNAEYFSDGQWKRVTKETSLYENTFIKAKDKFEVSFKNGKKDGTRCCAKSEKGKKLKDLFESCESQKTIVGIGKTGPNKGKDLHNAVIQKTANDFPINFHYLLVGIHDFQDTFWDQLPDPTADINALREAIENKMIPNNHFQLSIHDVITKTEETSRYTIVDRLKLLSDSVKWFNNDMVFLYLSSHGNYDSNTDKFHFITTDSTIEADTINAYVNKMTAKGASVIVFVDACYSGSIISDNDKRAMDSIKGKWVYYMSSAENKKSYATGAFVRALIYSTSGEALNFIKFRSTNTVTPGELYDYIYQVVKEQNPRFERFNINERDPLWVIKPNLIDSLLFNLSQNDNTYDMVQLGDIYYHTYKKYNINQDTATALNYYRKAYEKDSPMAACRLGMHYYYLSPNPDSAKAFALFKESAEGDCDLGRYYLSVCYDKGIGTKTSKSKAKHTFKKITYWDKDLQQAYDKEKTAFIISSVSAPEITTIRTLKINDKIIVFNPSDIHLNVCDPNRDSVLKRNAYFGDSKAQAEMGDKYLFGDKCLNGVGRRDYQQAYYWYSKSALQGDKDGLYGMGMLYMLGLGIEKDSLKAAECFRMSAEQNNPKAFTELGKLYYLGVCGLPSDTAQAIKLWQKAEKLKDLEGMYLLGLCYKDGIYFEQDLPRAYSYFLKCAKKGHIKSQYQVGAFFSNINESKKWLKIAINHGDKEALDFYNKNFIY